MEHTILYGKENTSKYKYALNMIKPYSKTQLKYKRKIEISLNDHKYYFNLSDIHFEVDFDLLGTNEYSIWVALYQQIQTICNEVMGHCIVLCKNFHCIKDELLDIFYIFMRDPSIKFILCTRNMSCLPYTIKDNCNIVCLKKKGKHASLSMKLCDPIITMIVNRDIDYFLLRELLYNLLTYNLNIHNCFYFILNQLLSLNYITSNDVETIMPELFDIIKKYNNNYRAIYHLERFVIYLIILKEK